MSATVDYDKLSEVDNGSEPASVVAQIVGCSESTVHRWRSEQGITVDRSLAWRVATEAREGMRRCSRCEMASWEKSPILSSGLCSWCHAEINGLDLHDLIRSGRYSYQELAQISIRTHPQCVSWSDRRRSL
jgi:uncharacterized paraquat-inducible protein A